MTRNNPFELVVENPKIERTSLQNLKARLRQKVEELELEIEVDHLGIMVEPQRSIYEYARQSLIETKSNIVRPTIATNNFEIKLNIIQMVQQFIQFDKLQDKDPNAHIENFPEVYDTFKINRATNVGIKLRLFPSSLRNQALQ